MVLESDFCQILQNVALVMAEEMGIIDIIVERNGDQVKLAELSHLTGYDKNLIGMFTRRLMHEWRLQF